MVVSGIERFLISVSNMDASLAFYRDWVGLKVVAEQNLEHELIQQLWNLPGGTEARAVFLKNEEQKLMLELIEFQPNTGRAIRKGASLKDYGIYDITFMVKDSDKIYKGLTEKGFAFAEPPILYPPGLFPFDVKESILKGPDETPITHMEVISSPKPELTSNYGKIMGSTQIVEDTDEAIRFYKDILGLVHRGDVKLPRGILDDTFSLPKSTDAKMAFFNKEGSDAPILTTLELSIKGTSLASLAKPPNVGLFMIILETDNLSSLMERMKKENITILSGPVELELLPYGKIRLIRIEGPSRINLEIFEGIT